MKAPLCSVVRAVFSNATLLLAFVNAKAAFYPTGETFYVDQNVFTLGFAICSFAR